MRLILFFICTTIRMTVPSVSFAEAPLQSLENYRTELRACRLAHGGEREQPNVNFFLFGMGNRLKMIYRGGALTEARSGREIYRWKVHQEIIVPSDYTVWIETTDGKEIVLREDSEAVWLETDARRTALPDTLSAIRLPDFTDRKFPRVLRVLHQELLVNITEAGPLPNYFVYSKPWYRDGAMMALALKETGNIALLRDWILSLREPFDHNNRGETEPDNLGQVLFLVSLVSDKNHPIVSRVLSEAARFEIHTALGKFIKGRSDFAEHPVYQTKWMKYGLQALGLPDPYVVPQIADSYSPLFWMDYRDQHTPGPEANDHSNYPYLGWACDHFHNTKTSPLSNRDYPLTWEAKASQARYENLKVLDSIYSEQGKAPSHTWHAAEAFLLLLTEGAFNTR